MKKPHGKHNKKFIRRHFASISIIILSTAICAGLLYLHASKTFDEIHSIRQSTAANEAKMDQVIAAIVERKAEEARVKQLADTKETAILSITLDEAGAASIDASKCNASKKHMDPNSITVMVNKKHCMQPLNYSPSDLVDAGGGFLLKKEAAEQYTRFKAAADAAGIPINLTSGYRSFSNQVGTYAHWVGVSGPEGADTYSARPGYSEHQTGLAFDIASNGCALSCFGSSQAYTWVETNAAEFGFIQRYYAGYEAITGYSAEEWHYRYVGATIAKDMKAKGIKTLEQYWDIPGGNYF